MASLRKKPADAVSTSDAAPPIEMAIGANAPPSPSPATEPVAPEIDGASQALKAQVAALRASEAMIAAEQRRQAWVANNPLAQQHYAALSILHHEALQSGVVDGSPAYYDFLNDRLAALDAQQPATAATHLAEEMQARATHDRPPEPAQRKPSAIVSAPVSREAPSASGYRQPGRITLTREQLEVREDRWRNTC